MSCRRSRRLVLEYVFDELEGAERTSLESHLDSCPACRRRVSGLRRLWRSLPEPYPAALQPPCGVWERSWSSIRERITELPGRARFSAGGRLATAWRWSSAAAALCAAFLLGLRWSELRLQALQLAGLEPPAAAGYFSGLDSFQRTSDSYLQRSRLLLLELQQTGAASHGLDDPWLVGHSRSLLGEFPRHLSAARRVHNPQLEQLLSELHSVLRQILEQTGPHDGGVPRELGADLSRLLFKLEMLELPEGRAARAAGSPAAL